MNKAGIERIFAHPYKRIENSYCENGYYYKEIFTFRKELDDVKSEVKCSCNEEMLISGSVELNINTGRLVSEHCAGFGYLEVPSCIQNRGIGTKLMMKVIEIMAALKDFYSLNELAVSGWLSQADCQNGNWKTSVPLYEKVGNKADVKTRFKIKDKDLEVDSAKDFFG